MNCQIIQIAWLFEDPATCGLLFEANKRGSSAKTRWGTHFDTQPNMAYCDNASQGVSVKLISNKGRNAASDEAAECQVDL